MFDAECPPCLLVVEEVMAERVALVKLLQSRSSYRIYSAARGSGALEILARQKIELIVARLRSPYEDGLSLVCRVGEAYPEVGIIAIAGEDSPLDEEDPHPSIGLNAALRLGADRAVLHPLRSGRLLEAVEAVLALPH